MAGKYLALTDWLSKQPARPIEVSFADIERVLGFRLPPSSRQYVAHWHGSAGSRVATAIRDAGWKARYVDLRAERLTLEPGSVQTGPPAIAGPDAPRLLIESLPELSARVDSPPHEGVPEAAVVDAVVRYLSVNGWAIRMVADAAKRERGDDIRAERDGVTLVVEAKGYPSRVYADPRRAHEQKPTHPSLQARHWLSNALLTALHVLGTRPGTGVAIALPASARYEALIAALEKPLRRLGVGVLVVQSGGAVEERVPFDVRPEVSDD